MAIEAVHLAFPDAEPVLRAAHVSRWGPAGKQQYEPYSYMKADAEPVDVTALSVPIKGRLCFAGVDDKWCEVRLSQTGFPLGRGLSGEFWGVRLALTGV